MDPDTPLLPSDRGAACSEPAQSEGNAMNVLGEGLSVATAAQAIVQAATLAEVGMIAAEVAHELNNPATVLSANLQTLKADLSAGVSDRALHEELVEECLLAMMRINEISRRIRGMTRPMARDQPMALELGDVVREGCRLGRLRVVSDTNVRLELAIPDGIRIRAGRAVAQIFTNLFVNAADALEGQTSPAPRIVVRGWAEGTKAIVEFEDNGPGVPDELERRIFEPFVSSRSHMMGTGLGLTICRNVALRFRGQISLHVNEGHGACFRVQLPLDATDAEGSGG